MSEKHKKNHKGFVPVCGECGGKCCKYITIEIDKPTCKTDYDNIRWYLLHENIYVYIDEDKDWFIEVKNKCRELSPKGRCLNYKDRPDVCKEHGVTEDEECEHYGNPYTKLFKSIEEFEKYLDKKKD
ncbi:MAG: YkgJ family cysteine cluster protein [Elusimicrobiota bacterium]